MMTLDHVVFSSSHFRIEEGEDSATNPGIYGNALADWVADRLSRQGLTTERFAEDYGHCVRIEGGPAAIWIACASVEGGRNLWQMYIAVERGFLASLLRRPVADPRLDMIRERFRRLVTQIPGVSAIEWQV